MNTIKQNIIENFLTPYYKYSTVHLINTVIADIQKRSWFPCSYDMSTSILTMNINDNIKIDIKFYWELSNNKNRKLDMFILKNFE